MSSLTAITDYLLNQSVHIIVLFAVVAAVCFALRKKSATVNNNRHFLSDFIDCPPCVQQV